MEDPFVGADDTEKTYQNGPALCPIGFSWKKMCLYMH